MRISINMVSSDSINVDGCIITNAEQIDKLIDALETAARLVWGPDWRDKKPPSPKKEDQ